MAAVNILRRFSSPKLSNCLLSVTLQRNRRIKRIMSSKPKINHKASLDTYSSEPADSSLDNFVENLVIEKSNKWNSFNKIQNSTKKTICNTSNKRHINNTFNFKMLDCDETLHNTLVDSLQQGNRTNIINVLYDCIEQKLCPPRKILFSLAVKFARLGDRDVIKAVQILCSEADKEEFLIQAGYKHFLAEATWIHGNIDEALQLFVGVYTDTISLRRKVRHMVKFLISDVVIKKGEAALVLVINFSKKIADEYGDFYFLAYVWEFCFLSEWYTDNVIAHELMEQHPQLRDSVSERISPVAVSALREHKLEVVHRLLELLLKYHMIQQYEHVLRSMFDYKCLQGDIRSCSAIIQSSLDLDVSLTADQHQRFLRLLLSRRHMWLGQKQLPPLPKETLSITHFQMKF